MKPEKQLQLTEKLERRGVLQIGKDRAIVKNGLVYIETNTPPLHPLYGYKLDNPMTWDTFTYLYLLDKE